MERVVFAGVHFKAKISKQRFDLFAPSVENPLYAGAHLRYNLLGRLQKTVIRGMSPVGSPLLAVNTDRLNEHEQFRDAIVQQILMQLEGMEASLNGDGTYTEQGELL